MVSSSAGLNRNRSACEACGIPSLVALARPRRAEPPAAVTAPAPALPLPATPPDSDEVDLLARVAAGERDVALSALYARHGRRLHALGMRLLGDASLAEELVQETFVRLWQGASRYDPARMSVRGWIGMLGRRTAIDLQRRAAARPRAATYGPGVDDEAGATPPALVCEDTAERTLLAIDVRLAVEALGAAHREVLELAYDGGLTQVEIAQRLDVPLGTVKTRTFHALRALRVELDGRGVTP